ncbi:MAG: radical SAM protein [Candidatus Pacebacteria bacterium]|nr:radical SAM protein [Candidatus Paceibacterota bacterium]
MKILLINPPIRENDSPRHIPHGTAILANVLRNKGHQVLFLDINGNRYSNEKVISIIKSYDFDAVGIGGLIPVYRYLKWLSGTIKEIKPKMPIIAGGSVAFSIPEIVLNKTKVDIVCNQEGEETLCDILEALESKADLSNVKGIWFKKDNQIIQTEPRPLISDLDSIPLPAWDLLPMEVYLNNPKVGAGRDIDFISSRGCPYRCTFCFRAFGRGYRAHSVGYIMEALKYLKKHYQIDFVSFQDDEFMADRNRVLEFCESFRKSGLDIKWSCTGRVNLISEDLLKAMKDSGCISVSYGIESGSQKILNSIKKDVDIEKAKEAILISQKLKIRHPTSFILGTPEETYETAFETVKFCLDVNVPLQALMFAVPYPGTDLYKDAKNRGIINSENEEDFILSLGDAVDFTINLTKKFTDQELVSLKEKMIEEVRKGFKPMPKEEIEKYYKELYGEHLWQKYIDNLKDPVFKKHRELHGFNEL